MLSEGLQGTPAPVTWGTGPHIHQVVIAATGQVTAIRGPVEATHFLAMSTRRSHMVFSHSDIMVMDVARPRPAGEDVAVPGQGAYTRCVAAHVPKPFLLLDIPQLGREGRCGSHMSCRVWESHVLQGIRAPLEVPAVSEALAPIRGPLALT